MYSFKCHVCLSLSTSLASVAPNPTLLVSLPLSWATFSCHYCTYTMSGCTVGPDGKLLDAKDIRWFEDADSSEPINHATTTTSITTTPDSFTTIHPFFHDGPAPTAEVIAAQCSGCATCPSLRITDPDNTEGAYASRHKRKASQGIAAPGRYINRKVANDNKESSDGSKISDYECYAPALSLCHMLIFFSVLPLCVPPVRFSVSIPDYFGSCRDLNV